MSKRGTVIGLMALLVIAPTVAFAGDGGLYFGFGMGGRMINGGGEYVPDNYYYSDFEYSADPIPSSTELSVDDNRLTCYNATIGYRTSPRLSASLTFSNYASKDGDQSSVYSYPYRDYPSINANTSGVASDDGFLVGAAYSQKTFRLTGQLYLGRLVFVTGGIEYVFMKRTLEGRTSDKVYSDHANGSVIGLGLEQPLNDKFTLVTVADYSFTRYKGDDLGLDDLDLNIGGFDLGMELRYYVK